MKKIIVVLISILFLTGCTSNNVSKEKDLYLRYVNKLNNINKTSKNIPFDVEIRYDKILDHEIRYQVIIDNAKEDVHDIVAVAIHNKETNDVFPSIGIFDEKQDLLVNKKPSGIILVGYIDYVGKVEDFKCKIKLLVKYKTNNEKKYTVYYVTKK